MSAARVLVSGASVAGLAAAFWLRKHGFAPTVVERAPAVRTGGAVVDFRGPALRVLERMGVLDEIRAYRSTLTELLAVNGDGQTIAELPTATVSGELEVLKEELTRILYEAAGEGVEYLFADSITELAQDEDGVLVRFEHGQPRRFEFVLGADGLHSRTRALAFGPEHHYLRHLGIYGALFTTGNFLGLEHAGRLYNTAERNVIVLPARENTELRVGLSFAADRLDYDRHDRREQETLVAERSADLGWEVPRLLAAMPEATDFLFDCSAQIELDSWSAGRVALLGDAACCAAPTSGRGTSQALVAAYVLAGELAANAEHAVAFGRYERRLREYVRRNQRIGRQGARLLFRAPEQDTVEQLSEDAFDDADEVGLDAPPVPL